MKDPDNIIALRVAEYAIRIWRDALKNRPPWRLPAIVAVVVGQGPRIWRAPITFEGMLALSPNQCGPLADLLPDFPILLSDLARKTDEELLTAAMTAQLRVAWWFMKNAGDEHAILRGLPRWVPVMAELCEESFGEEAFDTLLGYLFKATRRLTPEVFDHALAKLGNPRHKKVQEVVMNVAQMLRREGRKLGREEGREEGRVEGRAEGRVEGRLQGRADALLTFLEGRRLLVSENIRRRILGCQDLDVLERWTARAATARSIEEVLAD